jgi:hypothetical protein
MKIISEIPIRPSGGFCIWGCLGFFNRSSVDAGWSSPVARQAHNLKVVSSNLAPATKNKPSLGAAFFV